EVVPQNGELFASFDFMYYYGQTMDAFSSTIDVLLSKQLRIDGNLMVELGITSTSKKEDIKTTAIYTYYYCPTDHKRINAHVRHEALKPLTVATGSNVDGTYVSLQVGGIKSTAIKDLNFGSINPYLHIYNEYDSIQQFPLDPDPDFIPDDWDIRVINTEDDVDLGKKAWASYDDGETGNAHAIIMGSTDIITHGTDEANGIQVKAHEQDYPHLPGLETDMAFFQFGRNSYETNQNHDLSIPKDFTVEFDAEFYTTHTGGYPKVDQEATLYHQLLSIRPERGQNISTDNEVSETYTLTTYVHIAPAMPLGSILTAALGRNYPYVAAELYKDDARISSGIYSRIQFNPLPSLENTSFIEKIRLTLGIIDWKNLSFVKKITFQNLPPDTYVLKVFRENNRLGKSQRYIGVQIINITKDTTTHMVPQPESSFDVQVIDHHQNPISNVDVILRFQDFPISRKTTNENGKTTLIAPRSLTKTYTLELEYNGFIIHSEPLPLKRRGLIIPINHQFLIDLHDFYFTVQDTWGLPPAVDINPLLIGDQQNNEIKLPVSPTEPGNYIIHNLTPNQYTLRLQYSSFIQEEPVDIPSENQRFSFNAAFPVSFNILDSYGNVLPPTTLQLFRENKQQTYTDFSSGTSIVLPPAQYQVTIQENSNTIANRNILILGERSFDLFTQEAPWYLFMIILSGIGILGIGVIHFYFKRSIGHLSKLCAIGLVLIALFLPWWSLSGSVNSVSTTTKFVFFPVELVTITETSDIIGGELSSLPELIDLVVFILILATLAGGVLLLLTIFYKNTTRKLYTIALILGFLSFAGTLGIYTIAMSEFSAVTVGSFIGGGILDIDIPGESTSRPVECGWGPGLGFYLYVLATVIILIITIMHLRTVKLFTHKSPAVRKKRRQKLWNYTKKLIPLIGIILLIYIIHDIGIDKIADTFLKISPLYIIISAALTFPRLFFRNTQWQYLLKKQKIFVGYWKSMKIFLISYFYGAITPGYLGLMIRIPYMKEATGQPFGKLFVNSIAETAVHGLSLYIMVVFGALAIADQYPEIFIGALIFVGASILIYAFFLSKKRGEATFYFFIKLMVPKKLKPHLTSFVDTFYKDFPHLRDFVIPFLLGIPAWIIIYSQIYILAIPLDIQVPYFTFLALYAIGNIVAMIPITTAGLGTREASLIFLFGLYGTPPETAVVISLAGHLLTDVLTGIYGFIISLTEARNVEHKKEMREFLGTQN
ncbi:MAG: flippase-like domain-containing protein, partial [Candidatus Thermoplasmatota archaeon]|nr:flippase-like domain-containing protein [Candidatus Thermoplasmatota archaeon]